MYTFVVEQKIQEYIPPSSSRKHNRNNRSPEQLIKINILRKIKRGEKVEIEEVMKRLSTMLDSNLDARLDILTIKEDVNLIMTEFKNIREENQLLKGEVELLKKQNNEINSKSQSIFLNLSVTHPSTL